MHAWRVIALAILSALLTSCAIAAPASPPPIGAAPPTAAVVPAGTTPETPQFFTEEFDKGADSWTHFVVDGSSGVIAPKGDAAAVITVDGGALVFDLQSTYLYAYTVYSPFDYKDVRVEASFKNEGTNDNNISLVCRYVEGKGWYEFNVANSGLYDVYDAEPRADGYVRYKLLADGGSNLIKQGQADNEYAIVCNGTTLTLFINGKLTRKVEDTARSSGKIGASVSAFGQLPVKVALDWIKVSAP